MATQSSSQSLWTKLGLIAALVVVAGYLAWPIDKKITLGLDLQGGTHMVLSVDLDEAVRSSSERALAGLRAQLEEKGVKPATAVQESPGKLVLTGIPPESRAATDSALETLEGTYTSSWVGDTVTLQIIPAVEKDLRQGAARQVRDTISRRINEFGVGEQQVTTSGEDLSRIIIQLPGLDDSTRVKNIITRSSVLEFRKGRGTAATREELVSQFGGAVPDEVEILTGAPGGDQAGRVFAIERAAIARGEDLERASAAPDEFSHPAIKFQLTPAAGKVFGQFTQANIQQPLAIVLDGEVIQYARIQSQIFSSGQITGGFTLQEANDAALTLRSGALPAKVSIEFEQTVGPSLGKDSIRSGIHACLLGFGLVVLFMLVWYKGAGINAVVALTMNMVLTMGGLAFIDATLTLPGIAGLVLTIGMAVDANVIIFERIKEELAAGKSARAAIDTGFEKAFSAILDGHVTPVIACLFLYNFGTGPIKGFAVTLVLGLAASMFTAVYVSHRIFDLEFYLNPAKSRVSIQWFPTRVPNFPFMRWTPVMATASALTVVAAIAIVGVKGIKRGVDFMGGTEVIVKTREATDAEGIRARLKGTEFEGITIQEFGKAELHQFILRVHGAESAVTTTTVNEPGGPKHEAAATHLIAALQGGEGAGKDVDLNSVGTQSLEETLRAGAGLTETEARAAAADIVRLRRDSGGVVKDVETAASLPSVPPSAATWLRDHAFAGSIAVINTTSVGPAAGAELAGQAVKAILWSLAGILVYMWFRFKLDFGVAAIIGVAHDVMITIGIVVALGKEFDTSVIAALLTLTGYSINDTIILFDRVRENMTLMRGKSTREILNTSVNQTLMRTILTSTTVFLAAVSLLLAGGPVLEGFSLVMTIGVVVGTYSTTFVASPIVLLWEKLQSGRVQRQARVA